MNITCIKSSISCRLIGSFLLIFFLLNFNVVFAAADGKKIFTQNCAACHKLTDQKLVGPGLAGIAGRVPSEKWLFDWVKNSNALIKSGDAYAVKIFNENSKIPMTVYEGALSDEEITAVVAYIKTPPTETAKSTTSTTATGNEITTSENEKENPYTFWMVLIVLIILVAVLNSIRRNLQNAINQKKGLPAEEAKSIGQWVSANKKITAVIVLAGVFLLAKAGWDGLMGIGVSQGYKPSQPIKFSHKIHAGDNAINCVYCHSGAEKGKTSGIPSANVCMNCHKAISSGTLTGETEIKKIYTAVGWNPSTGIYGTPGEPLKWNRVHNLPDFAYFNHQQHVVVGKQECKTCHGEVEKMDVAQQFAPLTMAWCVDCHRKTEVPGMNSNPYYEELHKKLAEKYKGQPITVDKMGGIDCARCHY